MAAEDRQEPRNAGPGASGGSVPGMSADRLLALESQVRTLAEAVRALAGGLEQEAPSQDGKTTDTAVRGARLAHELLLSQGL